MDISRENALELLKKYIKNENLIRHALAVEAVMLHFAEVLNVEDARKWGVVGLLHDIDYEMYPQQHCVRAAEILRENGYPEDYVHAVVSHGYGICSDVEPVELMEKVLYTIDELTGLIYATVLMRPGRDITGLELKSVRKKWRQSNFAAGVDRNLIEKGAAKLGMELDYIISETIAGMKKAAETIFK